MSTKQLTSIALYPSAEAIEEACRALAELKSDASATLPGVDSRGPYFDLESCELAVERKGLMLRVSLEDIPFELLPFLQRRTRLSWVNFYYSGADPSDPYYTVDGEERPREVFERAALALEPTYALLVAWELDDKKGIEAAIAKGADVNVRLGDRVLLMEALWSSELVALRTVLAAGADPNVVDGNGNFPLSATNSAEACRALLDAGADVNFASKGRTALHAALESPEILELLLSAGADPNAGELPVYLDALRKRGGDPESIEPLLRKLKSAGARFEEPCPKGGNARWYAGGYARAHRVLDELGVSKAVARPSDSSVANNRTIVRAIDHADQEALAELIAGCERETDKVISRWFNELLAARDPAYYPPFAWFEPHLRALIAARPEVAKAVSNPRGQQRWREAAALMSAVPEAPPQAAPTPRRRGIIRRILLKLLGG